MSSQKPQQPITQIEAEMHADTMKAMIPALLQLAGHNAQLLYTRYVELKKAGFSEKEALEIVKARPLYE
jgi:hypothetical protein